MATNNLIIFAFLFTIYIAALCNGQTTDDNGPIKPTTSEQESAGGTTGEENTPEPTIQHVSGVLRLCYLNPEKCPFDRRYVTDYEMRTFNIRFSSDPNQSFNSNKAKSTRKMATNNLIIFAFLFTIYIAALCNGQTTDDNGPIKPTTSEQESAGGATGEENTPEAVIQSGVRKICLDAGRCP
ncbi:hypothetical protein Bhyg_04446 [Pseudolycoriella hygida]|uniref:Uncharacterized protein n=1 Tax=Pseudolycoriella hygida TaxID=35572 RepID=A0A9Q0NG05_9DIPT|nr:hypothetical protein Bhyg_04446 [Pseudolycoriella hygida]